MDYSVELCFFADASLLEGPLWDKKREAIWCVSIEQCLIYCIFLNTGMIRTYKTDSQVGCVAFFDTEYMYVATYSGIYKMNIESGEMIFVTQPNSNNSLRFNDGASDSRGRFLVGTTGYKRFAQGENCLYSWNGKEAKILVNNTSISNGIDFSKDYQHMFFVDTPTKYVSSYKYDIDTGNAIFDKNVIYIEEGMPDGICMDIDGMLWVAHWGGAKVSKWDPIKGHKILEINMPCKNISSCCIGGKDNEYLFVTTAKHDDGTESENLAGGLFKIHIRYDGEML